MIDALIEALALKDLKRTGWVRRGVDSPESVAAHSWGMAWLVLLTLPPELNRERALVYALLHDLAEAWVGDHPPQDGIHDKQEREVAAMRSLAERLERPDLLQTFLDYEHQVDVEARFVKQLDRLDMGLQANRYASHGLDPKAFLDSARQRLTDPYLTGLLEQSAPIRTRHVLFLCVANSARSQMAEALLRSRFGSKIQVQSAGTCPTRPNPLALRVLLELGIDASHQTSTLVDTIDPGPLDLVITLCAEEACPASHSGVRQLNWAMADPDLKDPSLPLSVQLTAFRTARDALVRRLDRLAPWTD